MSSIIGDIFYILFLYTMLIKSVKGISPIIPSDCYVAENATIIGDVTFGDACSVWFNAVIRGDVNAIRIGNKVNIQDGAVIHCTYQKHATTIGNNVSIGHNAIVHGCIIEDNVLIGMGAIVMDNCVVKSNSIIAAGAVVTQNTVVESGSIWAGVPAKKVKDIDQSDFAGEIDRISTNYVMYSSWLKE
jgi:carbonic anhydrase/acetyltransferase-like protein (isoleucine patch superfamily)